MEKLDLTKRYKAYYAAKPKPEIVEIEPAQFLSISGKGDPSDEGFSRKIQALYTVAYGIKFYFKSSGKDFVVPKLEGLWWYDADRFGRPSMADTPLKVPRSEWEYRLLIRMPDFVAGKDVDTGIATAIAKKQLPFVDAVKFYELTEGRSVQMLHTGPFETEPVTLQEMNAFMEKEGLVKNGLHHEIYLSDFNKTTPEKLKTILRAPVTRKQ